MSEELRDVRTKVDDLTHSVLTAVAKAEDLDMAEIHRRWLQERAELEKRKAELIIRLTRSESKGGETE